MNSEGLLTLGTHESGMIQPVVLGEEEMEEPTSPGTGGDKKKRRRNRKVSLASLTAAPPLYQSFRRRAVAVRESQGVEVQIKYSSRG